MKELYERTSLILGEEGVKRLKDAHVAVFGVGGVGGYVCEALARAGIGHITVVDNDVVSPSNLNRQIIATTGSIGRKKTEVMRERILSIDPDAQVTMRDSFFLPDTASEFDFSEYDFVADCVDTVTAKLGLIESCSLAGTSIISSMGTGNKLDPGRLRVGDISETRVCPLARVMRRELKKRGIEKLTVVWSDEEPKGSTLEDGSRHAPGSISFVPGTAGLLMAGYIINTLAKSN